MPDYTWEPIHPLTDAERRIDLAAIQPLYESWRAAKARIERSNPQQLSNFQQRLIRRLSVETGILERIYDLDRGTTEALVARGFAEELVTSSTIVDPAKVIDILRAQESAIQLVIDCIANTRPLSRGLIHQLHAILTKHQETTQAVDPFGNRLEIPLRKGQYKEQPNNPQRPDGTIHEYCPPIHVDAEMENLIAWTINNEQEDPIILASWFHHRFTQIHSYQDGNGRLSRALTTMILLKADLLPLVIDRDLRVEYLDALERADRGDLSQLAFLFARLEREAILQALSVDAEADIVSDRKLTSAVIDSLAEKLTRRRLRQQSELRTVNQVALDLRRLAREALESSFRDIEIAVREVGPTRPSLQEGGSDTGQGHWWKAEVVRTAKEAKTFVNFAEDHYFVRAAIKAKLERLVFVVSFHHVGRDLTGIMEATAFAKLESYKDADDREPVEVHFSLSSLAPFVFTHSTNLESIKDAFERWLDQGLAVAVKEFGDGL